MYPGTLPQRIVRTPWSRLVHKGIINEAQIPGLKFSGPQNIWPRNRHTTRGDDADGRRHACRAGDHPLALKDVRRHHQGVAHHHLAHPARRVEIEVWYRNTAHCSDGIEPHAGEDGRPGASEEIDTIIPVLDALRAEGMALAGPCRRYFVSRRALLRDAGTRCSRCITIKGSSPEAGEFWNRRECHARFAHHRTSVDHGTALILPPVAAPIDSGQPHGSSRAGRRLPRAAANASV